MQRLLLLASVLVISVFSTEVNSAPKVTEKTEYYDISGKTGAELFRSIMRKGPRHGFMSKAIAVTRFEPRGYGDLKYRNGVCRTGGAGIGIKITYVYPSPTAKLPADVAARWRPFIAGIRKHEGTHGRIGKQMAAEFDREVRGFAMKDKPNCRKAVSVLTKDLSAIAKKYEKKQSEFDAAEHKPKGNVERLITALVKE